LRHHLESGQKLSAKCLFISMAASTLSRRCLQSSFPVPSAGAFLRVARRSRQVPSPIFDFLAPREISTASFVGPTSHVRYRPSKPLKAARRLFSISSARRGTVAVYNPKKDDDGNDMHVEITPRASKVCSMRIAIQTDNSRPSIKTSRTSC
jgi:hypothetical protein